MRKRSAGGYGMLFIRYGIGSILVVAGVVMLIVSPGGFGVEGFGLSTGAGLSVLLLNFLYRLGVTGDEERQREEEARRYLARHGRWPDERRSEPDPEQAVQRAAEQAGERAPEHRTQHAPATHHGRKRLPPRRRRGPE